LAVDGKWIFYGSMGGSKINEFDLGVLLRKRISLIPSSLKTRSDDYKTELIKKFKEDVIPGFEIGYLKPIID